MSGTTANWRGGSGISQANAAAETDGDSAGAGRLAAGGGPDEALPDGTGPAGLVRDGSFPGGTAADSAE